MFRWNIFYCIRCEHSECLHHMLDRLCLSSRYCISHTVSCGILLYSDHTNRVSTWKIFIGNKGHDGKHMQ
jgi:hypothetical protein